MKPGALAPGFQELEGIVMQIEKVRDGGKLHRNGIIAVDKLPAVTPTAAKQDAITGVMEASAHYFAVAPGNRHGTAGPTLGAAPITPTLNKTVDLTIGQSAGSEYYDIFFSKDAAPKWLARVTEAQRAAGCAITDIGVVVAGGSAGVVNVRLIGTGVATSADPFKFNNAYTPESVAAIGDVDCKDASKAYIHVKLDVTDLRSAPALSVVPFTKSKLNGRWYQGTLKAVSLLTALGQGLQQVFSVDIDGADALVVLVDAIAGQSAAATIEVETV
jgi:hypothetical protein